MNWPSLCNLHLLALEIDEPYQIYLNIDLLCLLAVDQYGRSLLAGTGLCYQSDNADSFLTVFEATLQPSVFYL